MTPEEKQHSDRLRREREFFDQLAATRGPLYWAERGPAAVARRRRRTAMVVEAAGLPALPRARVLEIGCGSCAYTPHFRRGWSGTLVGVDAAPRLLANAFSEVPAAVFLSAADVTRLPFPDAAFDAVIGNAILHHLPLDLALPELLRVLAPGGRMAFAEPNMLNPQVWAMLTVPGLRRRLGASPDETAFVRWRLRSELRRLGLGEVRAEPFDFLYPLTPAPWIAAVDRFGRALEVTPLLREFAGSLLISGQKPGRSERISAASPV